MNLTKHRLPIAIALLVVLGAGAAIAMSKRDQAAHEAPAEGTLPAIERDAITSVELTRPGEPSVRLTREGEAWRVTAPVDAAPDDAAIQTLLDKLSSLEAKAIAATRPASHADLEVDAEHGIHVVVRGGDSTLADLFIGATRGGNTMVRVEGDDAVLAVRGAVRYAFDRELKEWRDRELLDTDEAQAIAFDFDGTALRFERSGDEWKQAEGQAPIERFSGAKVKTLVSTLSRLRASDFAAADIDAAKAGLTTPAATVTLTLASPSVADGGTPAAQRSVVLRLGGEVPGKQERYLSIEGDPLIYTVSTYIADRMRPATSLLQAPEPGSEPPAAAPPAGMPGGAEGIPPELMEQIQRQLQQGGH